MSEVLSSEYCRMPEVCHRKSRRVGKKGDGTVKRLKLKYCDIVP